MNSNPPNTRTRRHRRAIVKWATKRATSSWLGRASRICHADTILPRSASFVVSSMTKRKQYLTILLPFASIILLLIVGEVAVRTWHLLRWDVSFFQGLPRIVGNLSPISIDPQLGWRPTPNYRFDGTRQAADGTKYAVRISQDPNGFRIFGDPKSGRPRVFIVGDSFTHAVEVSNDKTYYAHLQDERGVEVFAYGGGGYGSLQEFMVLDQFYDLIKPDLIIWQYSTNDLVNNLPELETASTINNNGLVRPYWVGGRVVHVLPKSHATKLREVSLRYCRLCYMVLNRMDRLQARFSLQTVETETSPGEPGQDLFRQAADVTDQIMAKVRTRAGSTPIVAFIVGAGYPYGPEYVEALTQISRRHDIRLMDVERPVLAAERSGTSVRAGDGSHWNETGHRIAGQALSRSLRDMSMVPPRHS